MGVRKLIGDVSTNFSVAIIERGKLCLDVGLLSIA
jgi:hypothetical protein